MTTTLASDTTLEETIANPDLPQDARVVARLLSSMGVKECEPCVINQFLEFMHVYVAQVLQDTLLYADHAGKGEPDVEDVHYAVKTRVDVGEYAAQPPLDFFFDLARETNRFPLPSIPKKFGVLLPPDQFCLTEVNYQVEPKKREDPSNPLLPEIIDLDLPTPQSTLLGTVQHTKPLDKQIPIHLKSTDGD